jgi:hypothetical protein
MPAAMSPSTRALLVLAVCSAAGCAGMSESLCRSADWRAVGMRDALSYGLRPQVDQYTQQCAAYGVQVSEKDYMAGWTDGYREFIHRSTGADCCAPN